MTEADANVWAEGTKVPKDAYHGTTKEVAQLIEDGGFEASEGGLFGPGVYTTNSAEAANSYATSAADNAFGYEARQTHSATLRLKTRITKPWEGTPRDFDNFVRSTGLSPDDVYDYDGGIAVQKALKAAGHDGLVIRQGGGVDYIVAFEKEQVVVVSG